MKIYIYSRKSKWTGRGDSIENQITMCREYIKYNIEGSRDAEIVEYEDEGYSGKNTQRPQFQRMIHDIKTHRCNYLVCYKLDRLGRNIADLANLIEFLNKENVSFISIKERFDTSTPIGKAMLYFAGVLAQMEREQIAERVRDNMIMLARKGLWLGGNTPLGFVAKGEAKITINGKRKKSYRLSVNPEEIEIVKFIFQNYLENQSQAGIVKYFASRGIVTKRDKEYTTTAIRDILTNPVYCTADYDAYEYFMDLGCQVCLDEEEADGKHGLMSYAKTSSSKYKNKNNEPDKWIISLGCHKGIVSGKDFVKVQKLLEANRVKGKNFRKIQNPVALLPGILYCSCGHRMRPKNYASVQKPENQERRFSYLCPYKDMTHGEMCAVPNVQGNMLDLIVCEKVLKYTEENSDIDRIIRKVLAQAKSPRNEKVTDMDILKQEIVRKKQEANNLITAIAKSEGNETFVRQIEAEIAKINEECAEFETQLQSGAAREADIQGSREQMRLLADSLSTFDNLFQTLSIIEKREYLSMMLEKVVWDGEEAHVFMA